MSARSSGLLLHVTSLPGGRLGPEAERFVEFCAAAGQRWWQVLPLGPPGPGRSPYGALSAFAGSEALLARDREEDESFRPAWLADYALFRALRDAAGGAPWTAWPRGVRDRDPRALDRARREHASAIAHYERLQRRFHRQWTALKRHAHARGVGLIGDLPLFVAHDSADVWVHRDLFKLAPSGRPTVVAGVPPDYFSATGQRWGHPVYRWEVIRRRRFRWWIDRLARMFQLFDVVRLDHFLGLLRTWEIPARARTARRGRWTKGPGAAFLRTVRRALRGRRLIAEDLGLVTPEAQKLRRRFRLPGMQVLQFCFREEGTLPHRFPRSCVVYTGTHDNDTTVGWFAKGGADRERARRYAGCRRDRIHWGLIRVAHLCPADLAVVPVQDLLGLPSRARMNTPGTSRGNWRWRLAAGALTRGHARRLRVLTEAAGR
ncbi:MAG: 4-alpha-glucanotransferase [Planctomycetota bacterium]